MNTKKVKYSSDTGYTEMVNDVEELLGEGGFIKSIGTADDTTFTAPGSGDSRVGLRVYRSASQYAPNILAYLNTGSTSYTAGGVGTSLKNVYVAYAYGNGFIVACSGASALPCADSTSSSTRPNTTVGVVRGKNLLTGDTDYCSFFANSSSYSFYTPDSMTGGTEDYPLSRNASIGAAVALHASSHLWVADNALMLTAIPDTLTACLSTVLFNGTPYIRMGRILIPTE